MATWFAAFLVWFGPSTASAGPPPVELFFKSFVGQAYLTESVLGRELSKALGVAPGRGERLTALLVAPENFAVRQTLEARVLQIAERLESAFGARGREWVRGEGGTLDPLFKLAPAEQVRLMRILEEELNREWIATLPRLRRAGAGPSSGSRTAFLEAVTPTGVHPWAVTLERFTPEAASVLPRGWVARTLSDEEMGHRRKNLSEVLGSLERNGSEIGVIDLARAFRSMLEGKVPSRQIEARIQGLLLDHGLGGGGASESLHRALGDMTLAEVGELVHGGSPLKPTPESLLGRYLHETGAASLVRRFNLAPDSKKLGPQRLVIALSESSFPVYAKYFLGQNFLTHVHTPQQETLYLAFEGKFGRYAVLDKDLRTPREGTLMPTLLLKSTEGSRASLYFDVIRSLESHQERQAMLRPWLLEGYCAMGGYNSCTHWVGNIPIGDRLVGSYRFPGEVDVHANNAVGPAVQVRPLAPYGLEGSGIPTGQVARVRKVWKVPGHEQLADVVGLRRQNVAGELANPGYVAVSLLGPAPQQRVPLVFVVVPDHQAALRPDFDLLIEAF